MVRPRHAVAAVDIEVGPAPMQQQFDLRAGRVIWDSPFERVAKVPLAL